jgi:hypothetical protein
VHRAGRRTAGAGLLLGVALAVSGCNTSALTKQELVVDFGPNATYAQRLATLHACEHVTPAAKPEQVSHDKFVSDQVSDIRFRIDHADDHEVAQLETCLGKQPGVVGVEIPDLTD